MITETQRQAWNAAVAAVAADPSPENLAARDALKTELLTATFAPHVEELMTLQQTGRRPAVPVPPWRDHDFGGGSLCAVCGGHILAYILGPCTGPDPS